MRSLLDWLQQFTQRHSEALLAVLVLAIGAAAVGLGATSIKRSIDAPFAAQTSLADAAAGGDNQAAALEALKNKDTDGDGLSDYDELHVYHTSPYLKDSDSDGIPDGEEVKRGTDPNCPEGKTCSFELAPAAAAPENQPSGLTPPLVKAPPALGSLTPSASDLRNLLKQSGLPADQVDRLSDAEVMSLYQAAVAKSQSQAAAAPASPPPSLSHLTPPQLRDLLQQRGISKTELDNVSDADLEKLYQETLNELQTTGSASPSPKP